MIKDITVEKKYIYVFNDLIHLKRILIFLKEILKIKKNFLVCLTNKSDNHKLLIPNTDNLYGIDIEYFYIKNNNFTKLRKKIDNININILVDRSFSEKEFKLTNSLYKTNKFKITFIEHNMYFQWGYLFNHERGYKKINKFNSLLNRNILKLFLKVYFSKLFSRALQRRINPFNLANYGIVTLVDDIYLYSECSYKILQKNKSLEKINKFIIPYPFDSHPTKPKNNHCYRICIYSVGSYKSNKKKIVERQTEYIKYIVDFIKTRFKSKKLQITLKFKSKEIKKAKIIFFNYDSLISITDELGDIKNSFDLVVVPIDSFLVIEYLRGNVPFFVYNLYQDVGPIGSIAKKNKILEIVK